MKKNSVKRVLKSIRNYLVIISLYLLHALYIQKFFEVCYTKFPLPCILLHSPYTGFSAAFRLLFGCFSGAHGCFFGHTDLTDPTDLVHGLIVG